MSVTKSSVIAALSPPLPNDVVTKLLDDYQEIKQQFFLRKFRPSELDSGRLAESVLRVIEFLDTGNYTPLGQSLNTEQIIGRAGNNTALHQSVRLFIPRLARILLDVRNRRDVAHVGGDVNPNFSDSLFVSHAADWILTELLRLHYRCHIDQANQIVANINEIKIPIVAAVNGFVRVQNTNLDAREKALVILYHKDPEPIRDVDLATWIRYKNPTRWKTGVLQNLDSEALVHYEGGYCTLLPKGKLYVEQNIPLDLLI
jgi:hypothetical protein